MNKNIKIAKELVRLAKSLMATTNFDAFKWDFWFQEINPSFIKIFFCCVLADADNYEEYDIKDYGSLFESVRSSISNIDGVKSVSKLTKCKQDKYPDIEVADSFEMTVGLNNFGDDLSNIVCDDIAATLTNEFDFTDGN